MSLDLVRPGALWLGLLLLLLFGWDLARSFLDQRRLARVADARQLARLAVGRALPRRAPQLWLGAALGLLLLGLARPRYGEEEIDTRQGGLDLCVALDLSNSMYAQDIAPSRLERAKSELDEALRVLPLGRVCAVVFAGTADVYPLTSDRDAIRFFLRDLSPADMPVGGTALAAALDGASKALSVSEGTLGQTPSPRAVLLITDGEDTVGGDLEGALARAKEANVRIFALGVGGQNPEPIPEVQEGKVVGYKQNGEARSALDAEALRRLATATGGQYAELEEGVAALRGPLRELQSGFIEEQRKASRAERFAWLFLPAALLLALDAWRSRRARQGGVS